MRYCFVLAAALAAILSPAAAFGGEINHSWDALAATARTGTKIAVTRMDSVTVKGQLLSIDDQSIAIQLRGGRQAIAREDVSRVRYIRAGHPVVWGTVIGAASAIVILWATDRGSKNPRPGEAAGMGVFLGAPAGALAGAVSSRGTLLYEAAGGIRNTPHPAR